MGLQGRTMFITLVNWQALLELTEKLALKEWWTPPCEPQAHLSQTKLQEPLCEDRLASPTL